jgi:hypothetical protein
MKATRDNSLGKLLRATTLAAGLATGFAGIIATAHAQWWRWTPTDAEIAKLEAGIKLETLPHLEASLPPLSGYARYYIGTTRDGTEDGEPVILGVLVTPDLSPSHKAGIHVVENTWDLPAFYDGGCSIINLVYSPRQQKIESIQCNGLA